MKNVARFGLWILSLFMPVVIAACYGVPADSSTLRQKCGTAKDSGSKVGIKGIQVTCSRNGEELGMTYTDDAGAYCVGFHAEEPCDTLVFEDVDGLDNGGQYLTKSEPMVDDGLVLDVELSQ